MIKKVCHTTEGVASFVVKIFNDDGGQTDYDARTSGNRSLSPLARPYPSRNNTILLCAEKNLARSNP